VFSADRRSRYRAVTFVAGSAGQIPAAGDKGGLEHCCPSFPFPTTTWKLISCFNSTSRCGAVNFFAHTSTGSTAEDGLPVFADEQGV